MKLQTDTHLAWLLAILFITIAISLSYTIYYFRKNDTSFSTIQKRILSTLRFFSTFAVLMLLLGFIIEIITIRVEKPLLIVGIDDSQSMANNQTNLITSFLNQSKKELANDYNIVELKISDRSAPVDSLTYTGKTSNYSDFFRTVSDLYFNYNIGAAIVIGDGIYNDGINPLQVVDDLNAPIYTIGIGDTTTLSDQAIIDVTHNPNVFVGNSFPIEVEMNFVKFPDSLAQLYIYMGGKLQHSENINIVQENYYLSKTYELSSDKVGLKTIVVRLKTSKNEYNTSNNRFQFNIEVHDNKNSVLFLSEGPHPDIGAFTSALSKHANFEITPASISSFEGKLSDYDLVVLNQLPSLGIQQSAYYDQIKNDKIPVFVIIGPKTSLATINNINIGVSIEPTTVKVDAMPYFSSQFSLFSFPENINDISLNYPPLLSFLTTFKFDESYSVLAYQKLSGIEMNYPLLIVGENENRKQAVLFGEGIWRWRLREYQNYGNSESFEQLFVNLFSYLCLKTERKQFNVNFKKLVSETDQVKIQAQVLNDIFEPVINPEVTLTLIDSTDKNLSYVFDARQIDYQLNFGFLPPGEYTFKANTTLGDKEFEQEGKFIVQKVNIESQNSVANFNILRKLSERTNGKFLNIENASTLFSLLKTNEEVKPLSHSEASIYQLIDWKILAFIIMLCLFVEWFLRKFWGNY